MSRLEDIKQLVAQSDRMVRETESVTGLERSIRWAELSKDLPASPDPLQKPNVLFVPGLTIKPWYDTADFPWTRTLEDHYLDVKEELSVYLQSGPTLHNYSDGLRQIAAPGTWKFIPLAHYDRKDPLTERFPKTWELVQQVPRCTSSSGFSLLVPGAHIRRHTGPLNTRLIVHLGLDVPSGTSFRVGNETRTWQEGKALIFDDSFQHEVWHEGSTPRTILLVVFYHPDLTDEEVQVIEQMEYIRRAKRQMQE
jgi:aspartate beta-hydroxylase